ncbi:hypothetical protein ACO0LO_24610 [Undibacterium sp. TJN25]|uniref:hypothetical protein n=1 Tax=Undibacterium sp. TJN25 TaxID=3413056 RepID=UPI003BF25BE3
MNTKEYCTAANDDIAVKPSRLGISSTVCVDGQAFTLNYAYQARRLSIGFAAERIILETVPKGFDPEMVGAEPLNRFLPMELQPYLSQRILLYVSARRSTGGNGGGFCGAGAEVYLNSLDIGHQRVKLVSRILVASCLESIELDSGDKAPVFGAMSVVDGRLKMNFLAYKDKPGLASAFLSENFRQLEFR